MRFQPARREVSVPLARLSVLLLTLILTLFVAGPAVANPVLEATLTVPTAAPFAGFGSALALDGDRLVVGAPWQSEPGVDALHTGAAYVFEHQSGTWTQSAQLTAGDGDNEDYFGHAVAVGDDLIVVGAPWESDSTTGKLYRGAAYIYELKGGTWVQGAHLDAGGAEGSFAFFGHAVATNGYTVAVGAPGDGDDYGAVHIFNPVGGKWTETSRLDGDDPGGRLGSAVALEGGNLSAAERGGSSWRAYRPGFIYTSWVEVYNHFNSASGFAGALHGSETRVVVGAAGDEVTVAGEVHFFRYAYSLTSTSWQPDGVAAAAGTVIGDRFGAAVALDGDRAVVGAPGRDEVFKPDTGIAYLFDRVGTSNWQESAILSPSPAARLRFGAAVAIDGTAIVVGAPGYASQESEDGQVVIYRLPAVE